VLGVPVWAVGGADQNPRSTPEQRNSELLTFSLLSWLIRFEQGLHADEDLFPEKELSPAFETDGIARAEMYPRYQSYVLGRQAGWLSANDIRRRENEPPIPGGDVYQTTPVGGEGNKQPGAGGDPSDDDDESTDGGTT
jgi:phage portal protein BeeE